MYCFLYCVELSQTSQYILLQDSERVFNLALKEGRTHWMCPVMRSVFHSNQWKDWGLLEPSFLTWSEKISKMHLR